MCPDIYTVRNNLNIEKDYDQLSGNSTKRRRNRYLWREPGSGYLIVSRILKSRDITLPTKVLVKTVVFPVVMYGCESWTIKKSEHWRICFQTVVMEKTLESPLVSEEIKPVHPKGNQPGILIGRTDAEAPTHWPPDAKSWLIGKDPDAARDQRQMERQQQRLGNITDSMDMSLSKLWETVKDREAWSAAAHGVAKSWTRLRDWITTEEPTTVLPVNFPKDGDRKALV